MTFRARLLQSYLILIALPLLVLSTIFYNTSLNVVTEQAQKNVYDVVKKNNDVIDTKLGIADQNSRALFVDKDLYQIFNNLNPADAEELVAADRKITAILSKYFSQNEDVYAAQLWTSYYSFGLSMPQGDPAKSQIYKAAEQAAGKMIWYPTYDFTTMFNQSWLKDGTFDYRYLFSATRLLNFSHLEDSSLVKLGTNVERPVLTISYKSTVLDELFEKSIPAGSIYMVLNPDDVVVASSDKSQITQSYKQDWIHSFRTQGTGTTRLKLSGANQIVVFDRSEVTGWLSIVMIPQSALVGSLVPVIRTSTLVSALALGGGALLLAYFILNHVTVPIKKLMSAMRSVGEGDFQTKVEVARNDEFGLLSQRFNRMNDRIQMLVKENYEIKLKEKEAEIQALNMQMNPHFLYNTLNIMNWTAIENNQKELSKMLVCLSSMLHYTSRKDWGAVPLSEELEWMRNYFYIMSARFEGKFSVTYDIEPSLYKEKLPRLLFQPFVENAILHGFSGLEEGGRIAIRGWTEEESRFFEIRDNGIGISKEGIEAILYKESASVGIKNTISRIQMAYGEAYGIRIHSVTGQGTSVIVHLPQRS
ncbi:two-component system, sensor histidine kinase YesM [Paenibacillus sp. UNCCL117]|uniref:sensor histidine kinase n=1 Tax=unclassified Paenibacillus TaxID=185978 RepID=UPI0008853456|nr:MULTISPECIES: histidine kinase [unclassified Paenibacillus]SDD33212.1 two-component system, sensor histidine kinase YesM [Paenibacillus sp. cl123]SFW39631.1 two-component system, sensor histidine kinase YesM [Paenibacillus sp. UNCCL117]